MWVVRVLAILAHLFFSITLSILGVPIVAVLAYLRAWEPTRSPLGKTILRWRPEWAFVFGNMEDGVVPPQAVNGKFYMPESDDRVRAFVWCALRNKASNLRFLKPFGFVVRPSLVRSVGNVHNPYTLPTEGRLLWCLTWQGAYAGLWVVSRPFKRQLRIGWQLVPADADGFNADDLRQVWCGFSVQLNGAAV